MFGCFYSEGREWKKAKAKNTSAHFTTRDATNGIKNESLNGCPFAKKKFFFRFPMNLQKQVGIVTLDSFLN